MTFSTHSHHGTTGGQNDLLGALLNCTIPDDPATKVLARRALLVRLHNRDAGSRPEMERHGCLRVPEAKSQ